MKKLLLLLIIPFLSFGQADIVGGDDANIQDYPYMAALIGSGWGGGYPFCGASIINEYWILTAAHCMSGQSANNTSVRVGTSTSYALGGDTYDVAQIITHENYSSTTNGNDIALLRLENPIEFSNTVSPVLVICDQQVQLGVQDPGEMSWVTGWGENEGTANNPNQLQVVGVPITTQSNYGGISSDMIMAGYASGGYDSCQGDSGGPMVVLADDGQTYMQVGVVSWGSGCAEPNYPGVYARVSYFIDWICENTDGAVCPNQSTFCDSNAVGGCTDATALNYNSNATYDNGSCEYACDNNVQLSLQLDCYGEEISWNITNDSGATVQSVSSGTYPGGSTLDNMEVGGSLQEQEICLSAGCYTFTITDGYGDGLAGSQWFCEVNGAPFSLTDQNGILLFEETSPTFGDCEALGDESLYDTSCSQEYFFCVSIGNPIYGCTDSNANNYNPDANTDDGSCIIEGCTDENFLEYDATATIDDDSCLILIIEGCTDSAGCNYNSLATYNDGSCIYLDGICETCEDINNDGILEIIDNDSDDDGLCNDVDSCEDYDDNVDVDGDGIADGCDVCPNDADNDADGDGICGDVDVCEGYDDNVDVDGDGIADGCDVCPNDADNDADGDGVCGDVDVCEGYDDNVDVDGDGIADGCDVCPNDANDDADGDGICGDVDVCEGYDDNVDVDGDGIADACDVCPNDEYNDTIYPNGICDDLDILGCMDSTGCNYNSLATFVLDGVCIYIDGVCETCEDGLVVDNDIDNDGVCDVDEVSGCQDSAACNYNVLATDSDGSCIYLDGICETCEDINNDGIAEIIDNDSDDDGLCNDIDIAGCTNSDDCNYNPNATEYALGSCSCLLEDFVSDICYVSVENENVILYWNSFGGECSVSVLEQTSPSNWSEYTVSESFNTNSYNIYRENQFGEYVWLNTVQSNEDNLSFVDTESNALQQSYSYLLTTIDDCGNESALETISRHKTIHLSSNQGINGEINLLWNPYEGFDYNVFDIWRSNNGGDFELIGQVSTSNLTYTDLTPPIGQNQYFISVTQLDECAIIENARVSSVNSSQSNTLDLTNSSSSISDLESYRALLGIIDVLGRETHNNKDFQLHIYDDGSVEKKYVIK